MIICWSFFYVDIISTNICRALICSPVTHCQLALFTQFYGLKVAQFSDYQLLGTNPASTWNLRVLDSQARILHILLRKLK